ncbi:4Fe-4S binding protein [Methanobrevibacter sp.]|uniref:4Fe-4S binding protein n=1 Tax=Methanobrevibacter sp. TaxID=66852 RepID=UPI00388F0927
MVFRVEKNCVGCGDCAKACDLNLITVYDNYIEIDIEKCQHCSKCVSACTNNVFTKTVILKHFLHLFKSKIGL